MILSFHFKHSHAKDIITIKKKKKKEKKKKMGSNTSKDIMLKNIIIKKSLNTSHLMCLKIFCITRKKISQHIKI